MRFTYLGLENYIGIYNGMGLHRIDINLSLCKHKMLIIRGENGSGKSTIFNAMNVLPDSNDMFIPGMAASKEVHLMDGAIIYKVLFIHPVKADGSRDTTKAYISKSVNGSQFVEMNPNGNVTSFKDLLYDELGLDPNFIALSQLSLDDKGLAGKKPAERKRFVNAIMTSLDVYNNIYKTLSKKSNSIKAVMNTLVTKLGALGDFAGLQATLDNIENQINIHTNNKDDATQQLMRANAKKELLDPDGSIQSTHTRLASKVAQNKKDLKNLLSKLPFNVFDVEFSITDIKSKINDLSLLIENKQNTIINLKNENKNLEADIRKLEGEKDKKQQLLRTISSEDSFDELCNAIDGLEDTLSFLESEIAKTGIAPGIVNKDEYILALNTLKDIKESIQSIKDRFDYDMLSEIMTRFRNNEYTSPYNVDMYNAHIEKYMERYPKLSEKATQLDADLVKLSKLQLRPLDCDIDNCPFIKDYIAIRDRGDIAEQLSECIREMTELEICYDNAKFQLDRIGKWNTCLNSVRNLLRLVELNGAILTRLPHGAIYTNTVTFIDALFNNEDFAYVDEIYKYIELANYFDEYNANKDIYDNLVRKRQEYLSKSSIIDELNKDINQIATDIEAYKSQIQSNEEKIAELENDNTTDSLNISIMSNHLAILERCLSLINNIKEDSEKMNELVDKMAMITSCDTIIEQYRSRIIECTKYLEPLLKERDKVNHAIQLAIDYQNELKVIKEQYDMIESIKYFSSPTTGIQLVFMELYLGKIISLANELLQNLFGGQYVIQPFIINESEFRIPCLGDGYLNDDISSMSSAQIAMISMIISFALLYNSSTKYNIIKLDEIDGPLDENNRILFTEVLNRIMAIMNTEQCVLISHNSELNVDNSDIILLKSSNLSLDYTRGNVIWKY